jgi:hypothetical protein
MSGSWRTLIVVTALSSLWVANAFAQNLPAPISSQSVDREAATATVAYWTPERRASAIPIGPVGLDANNVPPASPAPANPGEEGSTSGQAPGGAPLRAQASPAGGGAGPLCPGPPCPTTYYAYPEPFTRADVTQYQYDESLGFVQYPHSTVGKLFFTIPGQGNFVCSASVVRPHLLLTARHCVYNGVFFTNTVFFPAYHAGGNVMLSPDGLGSGWPERSAGTWGCPCNLDQYDIAFIQTFDDDGVGCGGSAGGNPIENYTGFLGTIWAGNPGNEPVRHYHVLGYPQGAPFTGNWMVQTDASTGDFDFLNITDTIGIGSDQTGGTSGGPWIIGFDTGSNPAGNPGTNQANGLNSYVWVNPARPMEINGPQFKDYNFNQLRIFAENISCP